MTNSKSSSLIIGGTLCVVLLIFLFFIKVPTIQISYPNGNLLIKDETFEIGWIHSVEKEPWYETYERRNDELFLVKTRFKTFGAGTPSDGEVIPSNDGYIHMRINRKIKTIHLTVSKNVKTTLYINSKTIPLYEQVNNHETVEIEIVKLPLWQYIRGEKL